MTHQAPLSKRNKPISECERCAKQDTPTIMSMFNQDVICLDCKEKERRHPLYKEAQAAEIDAYRRGVKNFPGIGKPEDL